MDGLLLDTEDKYSECTNTILNRYGRGDLPWDIKSQLQGRPGPAASAIFHQWAKLPISDAEYHEEVSKIQVELFPTSGPLPGVEELLDSLVRANVQIALATSSHSVNFKLKTSHLEELFSVFSAKRRVLGDDPRVAAGRGKPAPDIYLLALEMVNQTLPEGVEKITPEECLVFEDSVPGVEAGRRAGMRVIWCPHPGLREHFADREAEILAGRVDTAADGEGRGQVGDGWGKYLVTLENFPYSSYGIVVPGAENL
jgi:pseudouridine-5'-monophosphatase